MAERIKVTVAVMIVGSFLMGPVLAQQPSVESMPEGEGEATGGQHMRGMSFAGDRPDPAEKQRGLE